MNLGISKSRPAEKPEMTDADIALCREKLKEKSERMRRSFEISLNTGCRYSETRIAARYLDVERQVITFADPKGGEGRAYTIPMPTALISLFTRILEAGEPYTVDLPTGANLEWYHFFHDDLKRPDLCFHCLRVTFVTRLARAGVPLSGAMRLVNHSSSLVHRVYQRLSVSDVRQWQNAVTLPAAS